MSMKDLGAALVDQGVLTPEQLQALEEGTGAAGTLEGVGRRAVQAGYVGETDLQLAIERSGKRPRLEEVLYLQRTMSRDELLFTMEMAQREQLPIGTVLKNLDMVDGETLARAVAIQHDLRFMRLDGVEPFPALAALVGAGKARDRGIVPVALAAGTLTLAMGHPLPAGELKELETATALALHPVIALEGEIRAFQDRLYSRAAPHTPATARQAAEGGAERRFDPLFDDEEFGRDEESDSRQVSEEDSKLVKLVNRIICEAHRKNASDIHIEPYPGKDDVMVRLRIDGCCEEYLRIPGSYRSAIPSRIKIMADLDIAERRKPQDGKIQFKKFGPLDIELRVATMPTAGGLEDVVIRLLHNGTPTPLDELGLNAGNFKSFSEAIANPYGLILVVGPTGSGKTTTLHSAIARINRPNVKIWTAEDPVEITQRGLRQVQVNPRIGFTFAQALRSFLRLDPDVIMVGEMRDEETASTAVEASLTGHLVLSTLHTNTAPDTVTRLLDMGLDPFSFSDALLAVLAQRLARRLCAQCREWYVPTAAERDGIIDEYGGDLLFAAGMAREEIRLARPVGCGSCQGSGYAGRLGIHELLVCGDELRELIRKRADTAAVRRQAILDGMLTLKQDGILKVLQGLTDIHEIRRVCVK